MARSSFAEAYPPNCLADYERNHHIMDSYQLHTHPRPAVPHTSSVHSTSSWAPKLPWAKDWQHINFSHLTHHFHFPATSIHDFKSHVENIQHEAHSPVSVSAWSPWVPDTDISETKLAYHIEIEVPCVTDRKAMVIRALSPNTLLIQGGIYRPDIAAAEGTADWSKRAMDGPLMRRSHKRSVKYFFKGCPSL